MLRDAIRSGMPLDVRVRMAKAAVLDAEVAHLLAAGEDSVRISLINNPACPPDILGQLATDPVDTVREQAAARLPGNHPVILTAIAQRDVSLLSTYMHTNSPVHDERISPQMISTLWDVLSTSGHHRSDAGELRTAMVQADHCPTGVLRQAAQSSYGTAQVAALVHHRCPPDVIEDVVIRACDRHASGLHSLGGMFDVLLAATRNPRYSSSALAEMADAAIRDLGGDEKGNASVLAGDVARHPNCSPDVIDQLRHQAGYLGTDYYDSYILSGVVENPNCPPHLLREIMATAPERFDGVIVSNPNCPADVLIGGAGSDNKVIRERALANPNLPEEYRYLSKIAR